MTTLYVTRDNQQEDSYATHIHNNKTLYVLHSTPNMTTLYVTCDTKQEDSYVEHTQQQHDSLCITQHAKHDDSICYM